MQYEIMDVFGATCIVAMVGDIRKSTIITGEKRNELASKWLRKVATGYQLSDAERARLDAFDCEAGVYRKVRK